MFVVVFLSMAIIKLLDMVVKNRMNLLFVFVPRFLKGYCVYLISLIFSLLLRVK